MPRRWWPRPPGCRGGRCMRARWTSRGPSRALQVGLQELQFAALIRGPPTCLEPAEFDAADLAADRLGQLVELDAPDALIGGEPLPGVGEDAGRGLGPRRVA